MSVEVAQIKACNLFVQVSNNRVQEYGFVLIDECVGQWVKNKQKFINAM